MTQRLDQITPEAVAELLTTNAHHRTFAIIDVRDADLGELVIHKAVNIPARNFRATAPSLVSMFHAYDLIVVHCMYSQTRGPMCAQCLAQAFDASPFKDSTTTVAVLRGGFCAFYSAFFDKPALFDAVKD